ncbi:MAG: anti-sigma factor [Gammaproteobacteria bacterium]
MKRDQPEILDLLAAEYVLGTLRGAARRNFARRRERDPFVDRRVRSWEERFATLVSQLAPVAPSPAVWTAIERRIGAPPQRRWPAVVAAAAAAIAAFGLGWLLWQQLRPGELQATVVVATAEGAALWRVELAADAAELEVTTIGDVRHPAARSLELWALPADSAPVSLGLMPARGRVRLVLDDRQRAALAVAANVAVSDEPAGGSPTGAPTGPVLYVAALARI